MDEYCFRAEGFGHLGDFYSYNIFLNEYKEFSKCCTAKIKIVL